MSYKEYQSDKRELKKDNDFFKEREYQELKPEYRRLKIAATVVIVILVLVYIAAGIYFENLYP